MYRAPEDFFSPEQNVIAYFEIDAFARELNQKTWSEIGITKAPIRVKSAYGQTVHSVGFTPDGLLVSASGRTLPESGHEVLFHTASTQQGFSGSILLCGTSVVGMHVRAAGDYNVAVRVELIQYLIDEGTNLESASKNRKKYAYANASYKEHYRQHKWRGGVATMKQLRDGKFAIVLQSGEATYGWDRNDIIECFGATGNYSKDADLVDDMIRETQGGRRVLHRDISFDDERYHRSKYENRPLRKRGKSPVPKTSKSYTIEGGLKPMHGPKAPPEQPEAVQVISDHAERLAALGYQPGKFSYPSMTPQEESTSLLNHIDLFQERSSSIAQPPTEKEMSRAQTLTATMMADATFLPHENYKSVEHLVDLLNSSLVDVSRSAGLPYCVEGLTTNGRVLGHFGVRGFAQEVLNKWSDKELTLKTFLKGEPTKEEKLKRGMPRIIAGYPLHVAVKNTAIFLPLTKTLIDNMKNTPVKFAWNPAKPSHLEHMAEVLDGPVWESDKSNWDYMFHSWIADGVQGVIEKLALKPPGWTEEQYQTYLEDISGCFEQTFHNASYRTSDGQLVKPKTPGIMKSGWYLTIVANSIAQLFVHVMVCIRLKMSDEEILAAKIVVGGDDVNQEPVPAGVDKYVDESKKLGVPMEINQRESIYHAEYFSSDIRKGPEGPQFFPKRWTKHIEHLKRVRRDDLANALCSHMENYRHDAEKFDTLLSMYMSLHEKYPADFPKNRLKSRNLLVAEQYGHEAMLEAF